MSTSLNLGSRPLTTIVIINSVCFLLRRFDFSRKTGEAGELEARETGDEHARDHGKEKGERRNVCENSVDFLAILSFSRHGTFPEFLSLSSDRF